MYISPGLPYFQWITGWGVLSQALAKWGLPSKTFQGSQLNLCLAPFLSDFYLTWIFIPGSVFRDTLFKIQILSICYPPFFLSTLLLFLPRLLLSSWNLSPLYTHFLSPSADEYVQYSGPILWKMFLYALLSFQHTFSIFYSFPSLSMFLSL